MDINVPISQFKRIGTVTLKKLEKLKLKTVQDLLFHYPFRYEDWSKVLTITELKTKKSGTVKAKITLIANHRSPRKRMVITEAIISDKTDSLKTIWFNQPFLATVLRPGTEAYFAGKIDFDETYGLEFLNPSYEIAGRKEPIHTGRLVPVYPTTANLSQKQIRSLIRQALPLAQTINDWLPREIRTAHNLPPLSVALEQIHFPSNKSWLERSLHRLKFDELFLIQLQNQLVRRELKKYQAPPIKFNLDETKKFVTHLPFQLTDSQRKSAWEILKDLEKNQPMNRLLEGDVGSGKTMVAILTILNTCLSKYQAAYMAPTEILAKQHFETIRGFLRQWPINIALFSRTDQKLATTKTQSGSESLKSSASQRLQKISKASLIKKIRNQKVDVVIGTHALIQEGVNFANLALVIIDEQHRFGVEQRSALLSDTKHTNTRELHEERKIIEKELSYKLNGIFFDVQKEAGRYLRERQYADLLEQKLKSAGIAYQRENPIELAGRKSNFADFIIENKILVELKAKPFFEKDDYYQLLRYLESAKLQLGLLVNFKQKFLKPKRILNPKFESFECDSSISSCLVPHFLSMTATPIPRSLALTLYGDLDLSIIDEIPKGRKKIITKIVPWTERQETYEFVRQQIKNGRQAFIICPLIDPSDQLGVKSVKDEYNKLKKNIFPDLEIAILHGQLKPKEKDKVMNGFLKNKINILVSTTVVEVGIDIANASIMIIEGAERFGLAQLYQLKGRIGRGAHQSYCFLFADNQSLKTYQRLKALLTAKNGFELAEKDLELRGPGEIFGTEQSGYLEGLKIAKLTDTDIIKEAQEAANTILSKGPELRAYPLLAKKIKNLQQTIHLE